MVAVRSVRIFAVSFALAWPLGSLTAQQRFVVRDVRVFDGERTLQHRSVLVDSGRIVRIGPAHMPTQGAEIDGRNRTLLPGSSTVMCTSPTRRKARFARRSCSA